MENHKKHVPNHQQLFYRYVRWVSINSGEAQGETLRIQTLSMEASPSQAVSGATIPPVRWLDP